MQGLAFLDKDLFTSYRFQTLNETDSATQDTNNPGLEQPSFEISLPALLETLSIFGAADTSKDRFARDTYPSGINGARGTTAAFDNRTLGMAGVCRITYKGPGDALNITLEEGNVTTTCALTTYEPADDHDDIPFSRDAISLKIIMRASLLYDAIQELHNTTQPERLLLTSSPSPSTAAFSLSATGPLGSASIYFANEPQLLETFHCQGRNTQIYKFSMIKAATRAMAMASKVSIRIDEQGVLSLQFMIEMMEMEGKVSFVDFRFVPFLPEEGEEDSDSEEGNGNETDA